MVLEDEEDTPVDGGGDRAHEAHHVCVSAATAKLPPFFMGNPSFWFAQVESQFRTKAIKGDLAKFDHVMAALSEDVALRVMPAISKQCYTGLKAALLGEFELTTKQRAGKLLSLPGLGDRRPSTLVAEILALVPDGVEPGYLEREIFVRQLPFSVQQNMAAHDDIVDLRELAKLADGYVTAARSTREFNSVTSHPSPETSLHASVLQPHEVGPQMPEVWAMRGGRRQSKMCFYHERYGSGAHRCEGRGCQWVSPSPSSSSRYVPRPSSQRGFSAQQHPGNAGASRR